MVMTIIRVCIFSCAVYTIVCVLLTNEETSAKLHLNVNDTSQEECCIFCSNIDLIDDCISRNISKCDECERTKGEICGGYDFKLGRCADPYVCTKNKPADDFGICALPFYTGSRVSLTSYNNEEEINNNPCDTCVTPIFQCPNDSETIFKPYPECCKEKPDCICLPCEKQECPEGNSMQIISIGTNKPGFCCDKFKCVSNNYSCVYEGKTFKDGEKWLPDKCSFCFCEKGLIHCKREECVAPSGCGFMYTPENECCPVCGGCLSEKKFYHDRESWFESDGCFQCRCENGKSRCIAETCIAPPCANPRKIANVCCPVCDTEVTTPPNTLLLCPSMANCSKSCEFGFATDENGCKICSCANIVCENECEDGYAVKESDRRTCECRIKGCPEFSCDKNCAYGFMIKDNCSICQCNPCMQINCSKNCTYGLKTDESGCKLCTCASAEDYLKNNEKQIAPINSVCENDGKLYENGEIWFDGCRQCICINGEQFCNLISCPPLNCYKQVIKGNFCCPMCPDSASTPIESVKSQVCYSNENQLLTDGEKFKLDACTSCICLKGLAFCKVVMCPPLRSEFIIYEPNTCCPVPDMSKKNSFTVPSLPNERSLSCDDGKNIHYDGDIWKINDCENCYCQNGVIHCFSYICPLVNCANPVVKKGYCCPFCLEHAKTPVCIFNGIVYRDHEYWNVSDCSACYCNSAQIICTTTTCSLLNCMHPILIPGQCCPVCIDSSIGFSRNISVSVKSALETKIILIILTTLIFILILAVLFTIILILRRNSSHLRQKPVTSYSFESSRYGSSHFSDYNYIKYNMINNSIYNNSSSMRRSSFTDDSSGSMPQLSSEIALCSDTCCCEECYCRSQHDQDLSSNALNQNLIQQPSTIYL